VGGQPVKISNVTDAMKLGIAFIHQELNVLDNLDVAANVFLGREPLLGPFQLIDQKKIHADTEPYLKRLGLNISSKTRLDRLPIAQQQMVEIAKALSLNARIIIMDEPTSSLTLSESRRRRDRSESTVGGPGLVRSVRERRPLRRGRARSVRSRSLLSQLSLAARWRRFAGRGGGRSPERRSSGRQGRQQGGRECIPRSVFLGTSCVLGGRDCVSGPRRWRSASGGGGVGTPAGAADEPDWRRGVSRHKAPAEPGPRR
jgi:hypothetical protein